MAGFPRDEQGRLVVELHAQDAEVLAAIASGVHDLLHPPDADDDPVARRLFPHAYSDPTEDLAELEWQQLVHGDLLARKQGALEELAALLHRADARRGRVRLVLDPEQADRIAAALNDVRHVLAITLGSDRAAPAAGPLDRGVLDWLAALQYELVESLLADM